MFEDYYGLPYDNFNFLDFLLASGVSPFDPVLAGQFEASIPVEQPVIADRIPPEPVFVPSVEPTYTLPTEPVFTPPVLLPAAPEPAPVEPVYTPPTPQPIVAEPAPVEPMYTPFVEPGYTRFVEPPFVAPVEPVFTPPVLLPSAPEPAPVEPVYTPPTPQPIVAEPAPVEPVYTPPTLLPVAAEPVYTPPTPQPVVAEPAPAEPQPAPESVMQSLPAEQPVVAAPVEPDWASMTGWDFQAFQNKYLEEQKALNDFNKYVADQAAQGNLVTSPIGDPLTAGAVPGLLNLYGETPEQQALKYFNLEGRDTTVPITFNPREYTGGYRLTDAGGNVIGTANTAQELEALVSQAGGMRGASDAYAVQGIRPDGSVATIYQQQPDPGTLGSLLTNMAAIALPAAGGAVLGPALAGTGALGIGVSPAVGVGLGTAAGTAASGAIAGKSIEDILLQSAIAGVTAGGLQALAGNPVASANRVASLAADLQTQVIDGVVSVAEASKTLANAGASAADIARFAADVGGVAASTTPTVIANIANAASSVAPAVAGTAGGVLGAISGAAPGTVVQGRPDPADIIRDNPAISVADPLLSQFTPDEVADAAARVQQEQAGTTVTATQPTAPTTPPAILPPPAAVVTAPTTPAVVEPAAPPPVVPPLLPPAGTTVVGSTTPPPVEPAAPPPVVPPVLPPPGTTVVGDTTKPGLTEEDISTLPPGTTLAPDTSKIDLNKDSDLLRDILRYYSLGSGILDMLGVGQGGGGAGVTTPYTPVLGAVPTFGRGAFQPFTGDYETYAMGPEWSFFNQPAQTMTPANAQFPFLLPPATPGA